MVKASTEDFVGRVYGRLTVISRSPIKSRAGTAWVCSCTCGKETMAYSHHLKQGKKASCGCQQVEARYSTTNKFTTHGMDGSPTYRAYYSMLGRCSEKPSKYKANYWDRGIKVCDRWMQSFENFFEDMGARPDGYSLDRTDNDKGYSPENCRWIPVGDQSKNRRVCVFIEIDGVRKSLPDWAEASGMERSVLYNRISRGWDPVKAITIPVGEKS